MPFCKYIHSVCPTAFTLNAFSVWGYSISNNYFRHRVHKLHFPFAPFETHNSFPLYIYIYLFSISTLHCAVSFCANFHLVWNGGKKQKTQKFACWELKRTRDLGNWKTHRTEHTEAKGRRWRAWERERIRGNREKE